MSVLPGGDIGVAYYNGANGDLRLGVWDTDTGTWTDELVDGASSDVGSLNSLQTDGTEGSPVIAYLGQGAVRFAYKLGGLWQRQDVPGTSGTTVTSLSLELGMNSREHARIAYTTEEDALNVASLRDDVWQVEEVTTGGSAVLADVSAARDARLHLAFTDSFNGLQYAFRTATLGVDTTVPGSPGFSDGEYNPLDLCQAIVGLFLFPEEASWLASEFATIGQARQPQEPLSEHEIWDALTGLFNASLGGQHYIELYRDHGSEMGQLGLNDPGLLWDAYGTLQNFLPGLEALVTGEGEEVVVTQQVIDDALDIWQRLAAAGSPELAAVINGELAQYNNLQDFVGLTFDEWALAIGVNPPSDLVYLPVIVRP
jgi:hypothetical protein